MMWDVSSADMMQPDKNRGTGKIFHLKTNNFVRKLNEIKTLTTTKHEVVLQNVQLHPVQVFKAFFRCFS